MTGGDLVFEAVAAEEGVVAELGALLPVNPFATAAFFASRRQMVVATWVLGLRDRAGGLRDGCGAFLRAGRVNRTLEVVSMPPVAAGSPFWEGVREFCHRHGVTVLQLDSFGSQPGGEIPAFGAHCARRNRHEFVLDLAGDLVGKLSSSHKRNVKKAQKAGLVLQRTRSADAVGVHQALMSQSMERRRSRGEAVRAVQPSPEDVALLDAGAGELVQAVRAPTVLSSMLVLRAPGGGYYYSGGTSPEGMEVGAAHFLMHGIARELSASGARSLNLGGADEGSSLARYKLGFGATAVPLTSATCYVGPAWRRLATGVISLLRRSTGR